METPIKWGILGLGKIAHKFASDLKTVQGASLHAVASRTQQKANEFSKKFKIQNAYGSYEALAKDPEVDVIYIATPHVFHASNSMLCMQHGKAVLCEKPIGINAQQLKQMIQSSTTHKAFLMEGLWTNFMPHLKNLQELIKLETYGKCLTIEADFSFKANVDPEKRLFNKKLAGGALLDIGIYPVYLALKLLGKPNQIHATAEFSSTGVDLSNQIQFHYQSGAIANLSSSFDKNSPSTAKIVFEKATVELGSRFHETDQLTITTDSEKNKIDFHYPTHGYQFEIEHVQDCLAKNLLESPEWPLKSSLELIGTLDKIRNEIGLKYKEDKA